MRNSSMRAWAHSYLKIRPLTFDPQKPRIIPMRTWSLAENDPICLTLSADARFVGTDYSDDQIWDLGWWPKGAGLHSNLEWQAFNLEIGKVSSTPIPIDEDGQMHVVCMVTERQPERVLEQDKLEALKSTVFEEWLYSESLNSRIVFGGMDWSEQAQRYTFGSKTIAWLGLQLAEE